MSWQSTIIDHARRVNFVMQLSLSISLGQLQIGDLGGVPTGMSAGPGQTDHFP